MIPSRRDFLRLSALTGSVTGLGSASILRAREQKAPRAPKAVKEASSLAAPATPVNAAGSPGASSSTATPGSSGRGKRLLILGGTSFLGPAMVEAAKSRGYAITLFNRGRSHPELFPDLEKLSGDRGGDLKALEGRSWHAVLDISGYVPRHVRASAELLKNVVQRYVFISSISVYGDTSKPGMDETTPVSTMPDDTVDTVSGETYGPMKALCEQAVEHAMPGRALHIRPGLIVGPDDPTDRFSYWPVRLARGGEVLAPGTPVDPVQLIDVRDLAEWTLHMMDQGHTGVYNAVGPEATLTMGAMLEACRQATGSRATLTWADAAFLEAQQVTPWGDMPVWVPPVGDLAGFTQVSARKALEKGLKFRPILDTAKDTWAWWQTLPEGRRAGLKAGISPEREAEVLKAWHEKQKK